MALSTAFSVLLAVSGLAVSGCGDDDVPGGDAGTLEDGGGHASPVDIPWLAEGAPPVQPPVFLPCPEGWHEVVEGDGAATCFPYPAGEPESCGIGEAHFPSENGCVTLGGPCPAGDFADDLPADAPILFVLESATAGGDGTLARPHDTLARLSFGSLSAGTVIALGRGTYEGPVRMTRPGTLWGACAPETQLVSAVASETEGVVTIRGADMGLRALRIGPSPRVGVWVEGTGRSVHLEGVEVRGAQIEGIGVAFGGAVTANGLAVRDTASRVGGSLGRGLNVEFVGTADVRRAVFSGNHDVSVSANQAGSTISLRDALVTDTQSLARDFIGGAGVSAQEGASVELSQTLVQRAREIGVFVNKGGAALRLTDVVIRDTLGQELDGDSGRGLSVQVNASVEADRVLLERNLDEAIFIDGTEAVSVILRDAVVRDTEPERATAMWGGGLHAQRGPTVEVQRALFEHNTDMGIYADVDARLTLTDVVVRDTRSQPTTGDWGRGLNVQRGSSAEVVRAVIAGNRDVGVFVGGDGATVTMSDVLIEDTASLPSDGTAGRGLTAQQGAVVHLDRVLMSRNREAGVIGLSGASVVMANVVVRDTEREACAGGSCPERAGMAAAAVNGASMTAHGFVIERAAACGVFLADGAMVDLSMGEVTASPIGACIQIDGYDVARLSDRVRFLDNGTNLQATALPLPEPSAPVAPRF